jgi:hypothetical protein
MRAQTLPTSAGWRWIGAGFAIFRRNPPALAMLVIAYWFTVLLLNVLPIIGALAASLIIPGLSVGLMQAARNVEHGEQVGIQTLYGGLKENTRTLVALGALYLGCTMGILGISALADGGELLSFMLSGKQANRETVEESNFALPALIVALLMTPVMMAYWFAPVLAAWHKLTLGRALFFSFIACWLNWRPFLAYGAGLLLVAAVIPGLVLGLLLVLFPAAQSFITAVVTVPMVLMVAPAVFASFYASYRDIFGISEIV